MSNAISRRTFLKCAGATALAAGAASMLSGCDLLDKAMGSVFDKLEGACRMGGTDTDYAMVKVGAKAITWSITTAESKYTTVVGIGVQVKNYQDKEITLKASDITNVTVNGHKANILTNTKVSMEKYDETESLFETGDTKTYPASKNMNEPSVNGYVYFEVDYKSDEKLVEYPWTNVKFTMTLNGATKTFEVYKNGDSLTTKVV